jgi:hypothetical protein
VDLVSMFAPVSKWSALVATPGAVPEMIRKAFKLAQTERPGAVYLAIPEDVEKTAAPGGLAPLAVNVPRTDEPSRGGTLRKIAGLQRHLTGVFLSVDDQRLVPAGQLPLVVAGAAVPRPHHALAVEGGAAVTRGGPGLDDAGHKPVKSWCWLRDLD